MEPTSNLAPLIAHIDDIDEELAVRAFAGTSFTPERRGLTARQDYANAVNGLYAELWPRAGTDAQKALLAQEMERYRQGYLKHLIAQALHDGDASIKWRHASEAKTAEEHPLFAELIRSGQLPLEPGQDQRGRG